MNTKISQKMLADSPSLSSLAATHTPGPWTVEVHQDTTTVESVHQTIAMDVSNCDANLIAAAPALLAALQAVAQCARPMPRAVEDQMRAAIAKATQP